MKTGLYVRDIEIMTIYPPLLNVVYRHFLFILPTEEIEIEVEQTKGFAKLAHHDQAR